MVIEQRKDDHIDICLTRKVDSSRNWWDDIRLIHEAIPAKDLSEIDLRTSFLGKELQAPLVISGMTGGSRRALEYNRLLARAAEEIGIGMGVGSQRAGMEKPEYLDSYKVVTEYEVPLLLGNIGAPQLGKASCGEGDHIQIAGERLAAARDMIGADAVCVHLNYLQEMVQGEGETNVEGVAGAISALSKEFRLIAKETGAGISRGMARRIMDMGVAGIDVGGMSGTSFATVESYRDKNGDGLPLRLGTTFRDWGIPTPVCVIEANVGLPMISTGGIRNGLDVARSIALGATCAGVAKALLAPVSKGYGDLVRELDRIVMEIRGAVFLAGAGSADELPSKGAVITGETEKYLRSRHGIDYKAGIIKAKY